MLLLFLTGMAILAAMTLGIMSVIGLFNKKVSGQVDLIVRFIRTLEISWKNLRRLPSRFCLLLKVLPHKRRLLFRKVLARMKANRRERVKRRRDRRRHRKDKRRKLKKKSRQKKIKKTTLD